jgi:hypothetical protein
MYIKYLIEKLILEEIEGFNRGNNIKVPTSINDLESDIYNSDLGEIDEKFANKDYKSAAYELSNDLKTMVEEDPIKTLKDYETLLLFIYKNRSLELEDPIRNLVKISLEGSDFETNKNLINLIYNEVGYEVGNIFANLILFYNRSLPTPEQRDVHSDLKDWIKYGDETEEGE